MPESRSEWFVYILRCADDSLYTGVATDLQRRLQEHNGEARGGAKYTRSRRPVQLVHHEKFATRSQAGKREYQIKAMSRRQKLALIGAG